MILSGKALSAFSNEATVAVLPSASPPFSVVPFGSRYRQPEVLEQVLGQVAQEGLLPRSCLDRCINFGFG